MPETTTPDPISPALHESVKKRIDLYLQGLPASQSAFESLASAARSSQEEDEEESSDDELVSDEDDSDDYGVKEDYEEESTVPDPSCDTYPPSQPITPYGTPFIAPTIALTARSSGSILDMTVENVTYTDGNVPTEKKNELRVLPPEAYDWTKGPKRPRFYTDDEALHWEEHGVPFNLIEYLMARRRMRIREDPDYPDPFTMPRPKPPPPSPKVPWPFSLSDDEEEAAKDKGKAKEKTPEKASKVDDWVVTPPSPPGRWMQQEGEFVTPPGSDDSQWVPSCGQPAPPPLKDPRHAVYLELGLPIPEVCIRSFHVRTYR